MFCNECGKEVPDSFRFCTFCGCEMQAQAPKQFCTACGHELSEQTAFCPHCGARTNVQPASPQPQAAFTPQAPSQAWQQQSQWQQPPQWQQSSQWQQPPQGQEQQPQWQQSSQWQQPPQGQEQQPQWQQSQWQQPTQEQEQFLRWQQTYAQRTNWSGEKLKSIENVSWRSGDKLGKAVWTYKATGSLHLYRDRLELELVMGNNNWVLALGLVGMAISRSKAKKAPPVVFPMDQIASAQGSTDKSLFTARSIAIQMKNGEVHTFSGSFTELDIQQCLQIIQSNLR